jgi:hypothetical protein
MCVELHRTFVFCTIALSLEQNNELSVYGVITEHIGTIISGIPIGHNGAVHVDGIGGQADDRGLIMHGVHTDDVWGTYNDPSENNGLDPIRIACSVASSVDGR